MRLRLMVTRHVAKHEKRPLAEYRTMDSGGIRSTRHPHRETFGKSSAGRKQGYLRAFRSRLVRVRAFRPRRRVPVGHCIAMGRAGDTATDTAATPGNRGRYA